jgi:hypothetical protein
MVIEIVAEERTGNKSGIFDWFKWKTNKHDLKSGKFLRK